jgi:hypothetical protein
MTQIGCRERGNRSQDSIVRTLGHEEAQKTTKTIQSYPEPFPFLWVMVPFRGLRSVRGDSDPSLGVSATKSHEKPRKMRSMVFVRSCAFLWRKIPRSSLVTAPPRRASLWPPVCLSGIRPASINPGGGIASAQSTRSVTRSGKGARPSRRRSSVRLGDAEPDRILPKHKFLSFLPGLEKSHGHVLD